MDEDSEPQQNPLSLYREYLHHVMACGSCALTPSLCVIGRALKTRYRDASRALDQARGNPPTAEQAERPQTRQSAPTTDRNSRERYPLHPQDQAEAKRPHPERGAG